MLLLVSWWTVKKEKKKKKDHNGHCRAMHPCRNGWLFLVKTLKPQNQQKEVEGACGLAPWHNKHGDNERVSVCLSTKSSAPAPRAMWIQTERPVGPVVRLKMFQIWIHGRCMSSCWIWMKMYILNKLIF